MRFLLTAMLLIAMTAFGSTVAAEEIKTMPEPGQTTNGFTVSEVSRIESLAADVVKLTHDRTGARVIFVLNDDVNMGFSICFHTEPSDDTGMLHILEHAVCAASGKYPGRDVFFDAISQAYLTGMNAWTALSSTNYYATSMDENQLEVLADFFLDCAFNSALNTQPNYFYREGWRYEMPAPDSDLTVNGIVYNEMRGVYGDISDAALVNVNRALFPDTYQSRDSGGVPDIIPELSYEELMEFYKSCYSPANSVTMFYGNVDMERFLALLNDGYFSKVDPGVKAVLSPAQKPFDAPVYAVSEFPVAENSQDAGSVIYYSAALPETDSLDYTNYAICDIVADLLSDNSSRLMRALNASGIASGYEVRVKPVGTQLTLSFIASDADESRDGEFKQIIMDELSEMIESGFSGDMMRSLFARKNLSLRLQRNSYKVAIDLFDSLEWIQDMGNDAPLNAAEWYKKADELCVNGYAEEKIKNWVLDNPHAALVTTVPVAGLLEKNERALADKLANVKSSMTDEEIQKIVDDTAAFNAWVDEETPSETLEKISVVSPMTVEANWPRHDIKTETINGVTVLSAPASMNMTAVDVSFDVGHLTDGELARLKMLTYILKASTEARSQSEITIDLSRLADSFDSKVTALRLEDGYKPVFNIKWFAPNESLAESVDLAFELIASTDISANVELLAQYIDAKISEYRKPEAVLDFLEYTATASTSGMSGFMNKIGGFEYLDELNKAKAEYKNSPAEFADSLKRVREKALTRSGAYVTIAGDPEGQAKSEIVERFGALPLSNGAALERNDLSKAKRTAIIGSTQSGYIQRGSALKNPDKEVTGDKLVLNKLLFSEYLLPKLRFQMGAYNTGLELGLNGLWVADYFRGSDVMRADEIIMAMPEFITDFDMTRDKIDSCKLPAIADLLTPSGELNDALGDMKSALYGFTREKRLALIEEIRNVSPDDIKALAPALKEALEGGVAVIASASEIKGRESQFDAILRMP